MSQTIILKHSTVKDKLPSSAQYGEVFVNYHSENPFLATLNNQGQFEKFLSENKLNELYYNKSQVNDIIANLESGGTIDFDDYYKKNEVDTLLQGKSDTGHTHDYSQILNTPDLSNFATLSDIPSINGLASEVWVGENYQPKGNYLTEHQSLENYYTKSEADNKFLTSHQDLSGYALKADLDDYLTIASASTIYATKEDLEEFTPTVDAYSKEETDTLLAGKASSAHTHDYETLTNKPDLSNFATKGEIPDTSNFITSAFTEDRYQPKGNYLTEHQSLENYYTKSEADNKFLTSHQDLSAYALKSEIPDVSNFVTSAFTEATYAKKGEVPSDAYTKAETDTLLAGKANSAHTHTMSEITDLDIPKTWRGTLAQYNNLTEIDNDTLYIITDSSEQLVTSGDVESMISGYTNLTEVETLLEGYSTTSHTHDYSEIQNTPDLTGFASLSDIPDVSNFITSGFCEDRYQPKGTYVVPSDLDDYALKSDLPTVPDSYTKTETDNLLAGKASSAHTHDYETLTNKPDLSNFATKGEIPDTSGFATKQELEDYQMKSGMTSYLTIAQAEQGLQPKGDYALASQIPDTSNFITSGFCEDRYQAKGTYVVPSDLDDYALKTDLPTVPDSYTKTETDNLLAGKANSAHTHTVSDITDLNIPSVEGLASETWVSQNFSTTAHTHSDLATKAELENYLTIASASTIYATKEELEEFTPSGDNYAGSVWTGTLAQYNNLTIIDSDTLYVITDQNEQYVTQTTADARYARVVSCTQAEYDALVQNDQVEQGVLYCIIEQNS